MSVCRKCGIGLNEENWNPSQMVRNSRICKKCEIKRAILWRKANPEKAREISIRAMRKQGKRPYNENKECPVFLGVYIAEQVLSQAFKDVEVMPYGNVGYDFICNRGKKIDVKSSCRRKRTKGWNFHIRHNTIADYFLCLAFDNREDLTPEHIWLLPGSEFNHLTGAGIHPNTMSRWSEYELDMTKVSACCDAFRI